MALCQWCQQHAQQQRSGQWATWAAIPRQPSHPDSRMRSGNRSDITRQLLEAKQLQSMLGSAGSMPPAAAMLAASSVQAMPGGFPSAKFTAIRIMAAALLNLPAASCFRRRSSCAP